MSDGASFSLACDFLAHAPSVDPAHFVSLLDDEDPGEEWPAVLRDIVLCIPTYL